MHSYSFRDATEVLVLIGAVDRLAVLQAGCLRSDSWYEYQAWTTTTGVILRVDGCGGPAILALLLLG